MNLKQKTNEWVAQKLITQRQQESILTHETRVRLPYITLLVMWLGAVCAVLGAGCLIWSHWAVIPEVVKIAGATLLLVGSLGAAWYGIRREKHLLTEVALWVSFFMIGGGIGLFAQVFGLPLHNATGLLLWAVLSLGVALLSRHSILSGLWVPLFIGGILGFMRLELLLLFFAQAPLLTMVVFGGVLLGIIYLASLFKNHFAQNVYRWSLVLFFTVLLLGDFYFTNQLATFFITVALLGVLGSFAVLKNRLRLFHWVSFFFGARLIVFFFQTFHAVMNAGVGLLVAGLVLLLAGGIWHYTHKDDRIK